MLFETLILPFKVRLILSKFGTVALWLAKLQLYAFFDFK